MLIWAKLFDLQKIHLNIDFINSFSFPYFANLRYPGTLIDSSKFGM